MNQMEIAIGLIEQGDDYLLQHRTGKVQSGALDLIGCFGGQIEDDESPSEAVCRELGEETTLSLRAEQLEKLGEINVTSDYKRKPIKIKAYAFKIVVKDDNIESKEGDLVRISKGEVASRLDSMTPATRDMFLKLVLKGGD